MNPWLNICLKLVTFFIQSGQVKMVIAPSNHILEKAREFCSQVEHAEEPWEWKQKQVIRALMNTFPSEKVSILNLAIEVVMQECSASKS